MDACRFDRLTRILANATTRRTTLSLAAVLSVSSFVAGAARKRKRKNKNKNKKKVVLCHQGTTIKVAKQKQLKHLKHGDTRGPCCIGLKPTDDLSEAAAAARPGTILRLCPGTWALRTTVAIDKNLTIIGAGADQTFLDGGDAIRAFKIEEDVIVTLRDVTIQKGKGAPGEFGGGIENRGALTLDDVTVSDNDASQGGGITNHYPGTLILVGSRVTGNSAIEGGGIWNTGPVSADAQSRVTGNTASRGGGIFNAAGSGITIRLATADIVTNNTATGTEPNGDNCYVEGTITNCLG